MPRWSATLTLRSCDLPKIEPSMRPMRICSPDAVENLLMLVDDEAVARGAVEQHQEDREQEQERDEKREQLIQQAQAPVTPQANRRYRPLAGCSATSHRPSESLAERDRDRDRAVALLAIERDSEVDADRAEERIIANAKARGEAPSCRSRAAALVVSEPPSKNGTTPKLPPNCLRRTRASSANSARPRPPIGSPADVLGPKLLIAIATDRSAAARIEAPRRGEIEGARADDRAQADRGPRRRRHPETG